MSEDNSIVSSVISNYNDKEFSTMSIATDHIEKENEMSDFDEISTTENGVSESGTPADVEMIPSFLQTVMKADPELASDAKKKMDAENEKRINTLRENGAKGGRSPIDRGRLAKMCLDAVFTKDGQCLLRHYRGDWYLYQNGCYSAIPEEEIDKKITGCLLRSGVEIVSSAIRRDVLGNLKSDELCGLTSDKYTKPCLISTGESAFGFVSMKNGIIMKGNNMSAAIELTSIIQQNNSELKIRISSDIKGNAESKLQEIRSILDQANAVFNGESAATEEIATPLPKSCSELSPRDRITDVQVKLLKKILHQLHIAESDFCKVHRIACLEELHKKAARWIINELTQR